MKNKRLPSPFDGGGRGWGWSWVVSPYLNPPPQWGEEIFYVIFYLIKRFEIRILDFKVYESRGIYIRSGFDRL